MKQFYVILSRTNTGIGRLIRFFTGYELNHSAISFDKSLKTMYSFGRKANKPAYDGGFITETPGRYCEEGKDTRIKIFEFSLTDADFKKLRDRFEEIRSHAKDYLYNTYGAMLSGIGIDFYVPYTYICIEFVTYIMGLGRKISIKKFDKLFAEKAIYDGSFREYYGKKQIIEDKYFFRERPFSLRAKLVLKHFGRLHRYIRDRKKNISLLKNKNT